MYTGWGPRLPHRGGKVGDETEKFIGNLRGVQPGQRGEGAKGSLEITKLGDCERGSWSEQSSDFPATG